jgi:3-phosphoshikimate 1-carboxyvinyltransferase
LDDAPAIIDEFLILSVAAAYAKGVTKFCGVSELKVKESDRLEAIINMLTASGVKCETKDDDIIIYGNGEVLGGSTIKSNYDHRVAMSALILGLASKSQIRIDDVSPIATSFPNFMEIYQEIGGNFHSG